MGVKKVFYSLLSVWILFLTVTAFPSLSDAAIASTDFQNTFAQQTCSWPATGTGNPSGPGKLIPKLDQHYQLISFAPFNTSNSLGTSANGLGPYQKSSVKSSPLLMNCQLLI